MLSKIIQMEKQLQDLILYDGIYFLQIDYKKEGYYTENEKGELEKHNYKPPSKWKNLKSVIFKGKPVEENTILTDFYYFNQESNDLIYNDGYWGDIDSALNYSKYRFSEKLSYQCNVIGDEIYFNLNEKVNAVIKTKSNKHILRITFYNTKLNKEISKTYNYLNWNSF